MTMIRTIIPALMLLQAAASAETQILRYQVDHAVYGKIGIYENRIDRQGDQTTVHTALHLQIKILGIVVERRDAERLEYWDGEQLVGFSGTTTVNGDVTEISGHALDEGFEVTSKQGKRVVPLDVRPSNPWSGHFLASRSLMQTDSGEVEQIEVSPPAKAEIKLDNRIVTTAFYDIKSDPAYQVWIGEDDVPVRFTVADPSGLVTFSLTAATASE